MKKTLLWISSTLVFTAVVVGGLYYFDFFNNDSKCVKEVDEVKPKLVGKNCKEDDYNCFLDAYRYEYELSVLKDYDNVESLYKENFKYIIDNLPSKYWKISNTTALEISDFEYVIHNCEPRTYKIYDAYKTDSFVYLFGIRDFAFNHLNGDLSLDYIKIDTEKNIISDYEPIESLDEIDFCGRE